MTLLLTSLLAFAGPPPPDFDPSQVERWEGRARAAGRGVDHGCWRLTGEVRTQVRIFLPSLPFAAPDTSDLVQTGTFEATYDRGVWTRFVMDLRVDGVPVSGDLVLGPGIGTMGGDGVRSLRDLANAASAQAEDGSQAEAGAPDTDTDTDTDARGQASLSIGSGGVSASTAGHQASSLLDKVLAGTLSEQPSTLYVSWDPRSDQVRLVIEAPVSADQPNTVLTTTALFPGGGPVPNSFDSVLGDKITVGDGLARARVLAFESRIRGRVQDRQFLPTVDRITGAIGAMGFTAGYERLLVFRTAQRCAGSTGAPPPAEDR